MSAEPARPRPRPRPRARAAAAVSSSGPSSSDATPTSPTAKETVTITIDEEDAMFMRKPRTAQQWKKLAQIEKESKPVLAVDTSDDEESPRARKHKKKADKPLPSWTKKKNITSLLSSSEEDDNNEALQSIDNTPNGKRADKAVGKRKRERTRSRSITPPPPIALHQIQYARNLVRQTLDSGPRATSPTWLAADDSNDNIMLDPELAKIAREIRTAPTTTTAWGEGTGGGPEVVTVKVKWQPHPLDDAARPRVWGFKMKRHDNFKQVFDETADSAGVLSSNLIVSYEGKRLFSSATPHGIHIWAEAELEACDKTTYEYIRTQRHQRSLSPSLDHSGAGTSSADGPSRSGTQDLPDSDAEPQDSQDSQTFKLILRSALTSKDITLTVRPTTTCGAIVKAFLKSAGLSDKYPGQTPKKGGGKVPMLCLDGDKLNPGSEIGDAELEDGDLVEVVGL